MRRILLYTLVIILLAAFALVVSSGISVGKFRIASISEIIEENKKLDSEIDNLNKTIETDFVSAKSQLDQSYTKLQASKKKYNDTIMFSTEEEIKAANQEEKYKIGYLWTKFGLYATKNGVEMQANVTQGSVKDKYNISFTVIGEYLSISEFIRAIENDSNLGFKIEDFNLSPNSEKSLTGRFIIRNVSIDSESITSMAGTTNNS